MAWVDWVRPLIWGMVQSRFWGIVADRRLDLRQNFVPGTLWAPVLLLCFWD